MSTRRSKTIRPGVEGLEGRALLAVVVDQFAPPTGTAPSTSIVSGPGGKLWFTEQGFGTAGYGVGSIDPASGGTAAYYARSAPTTIAVGPDGKLWFTEPYYGLIGSLDPTTGTIVETPVPTANDEPGPLRVDGIVAGPDGRLWFTEAGGSAIGAIDPATRAILQYPLPRTTLTPEGIALGSDGRLWFTDPADSTIDAIDPTTRAIAEYPTPGMTPGPIIAAGPDGGLWFSAASAPGGVPEIAEIRTGGTVAAFPTTTAVGGIATAPDGQLAFTESDSYSYTTALYTNGVFAEINTTSDAITASGVPTYSPTPVASSPGALALGPDGNLWAIDDGHTIAGEFLSRATTIPRTGGVLSGEVAVDPTGAADFSAYFANATVSAVDGVSLGTTTVYLDLNGLGAFAPGDPMATVGASNVYRFSGLAAGTYTVRLLTTEGLVQTGPVSTARVVAGQAVVAPTIGAHATSLLLPLAISASPFGARPPDVQTAEVTGLYNAVLGRAPDAAGLAFYVGALKNGAPLQQVASYLLHSAEYETIVINRYYENDFDRPATIAEAGVWLAALQGGLSVEGMSRIILTSPAYAALHPIESSFVAALYADVLGHVATAPELTAWLGVLGSGVSRAEAVSAFLAAPAGHFLEVRELYQAFLNRSPDANGITFYAGALAGGVSILDAASYLASSAEYVARANAAVG